MSLRQSIIAGEMATKDEKMQKDIGFDKLKMLVYSILNILKSLIRVSYKRKIKIRLAKKFVYKVIEDETV